MFNDNKCCIEISFVNIYLNLCYPFNDNKCCIEILIDLLEANTYLCLMITNVVLKFI